MRRATILVVLVLALLAGAPGAAHASFNHNPILFVHGIEGTGAQFESQKMRFISNGYPASWFDEVDYDSTRAAADKTAVDQQIDKAIAGLKSRTGKAKVDVVAHSLGTMVMHDYLTQGPTAAQRRANVGHYVNVDGQDQNPGVPTLALWAGRPLSNAGALQGDRHMDGAKNVTIPNQTHVQTCTSKESFVQYYEFFTGKRPAHDLVPESGRIRIAGKTLIFPENIGALGAKMELWPVDARGRRSGSRPIYSHVVADASQGGGVWGPVSVQAGKRYEFAVTTTSGTLHYYYEPFVRSDYTVRLLVNDALTNYSGNHPGSIGALQIRYKELWGDQPGQNDLLTIDGLNICTAGLCPVSKAVNGFFVFDRNRDGRSELSPDPVLGQVPFLQGTDVFVPGSTPPNGTVTFALRSRGGGPTRAVKTPNWEATTGGNGIVVEWADYELPFQASELSRCGVPTKRVRGRTLDHVRLGIARAGVRKRYPHIEQRRRYVDRFCLTPPRRGGRSVRVGYPSPKLLRRLGSRTARRLRGHAVLALTSSGYYAIRGIRYGTRVRTLRRKLHGERSFHIGRNRWYIARGRKAELVFKVRGGRVREVGLASLGLTRGRRARPFLRSFG
ncbi:MAG TPA: hypothetical protein VGF21_10885 [Thermoleophilaceae bacterium]|jgi:hypothetical protein